MPKHHAQQFEIFPADQAMLELRGENQAEYPPPKPDATPALFAVPPSFKPTKLQIRNAENRKQT